MAPAGWTYGRADGKTEAKIRKAMKLSSSSDVTLAHKSGATNVVLVAVPHVGHSFVTGLRKGGKEVGATAGDGPHGTTALTYPTAYAVVGVKGCNAVVVDGQDSAGVTTLADTIFAASRAELPAVVGGRCQGDARRRSAGGGREREWSWRPLYGGGRPGALRERYQDTSFQISGSCARSAPPTSEKIATARLRCAIDCSTSPASW